MLDTSWIVTTGTSAVMVIVSAIGIYLALVLYTRLAGLRSFSKLSSFDFAITVAFGSLVASTLLTRNPPLLQAIIGLGVLYAIQYTVATVRARWPYVTDLVDNEPMLLMDGPDFLHENMKKARVTESDVWAKLREANVTQIEQVKAVVLETTGDISVLHGDPDAPPLDQRLLHGVGGH